MQMLCNAGLFRNGLHTGQDFLLRNFVRFQAKRNVFIHAHAWKQRVVLKYEAQTAFFGQKPRQVASKCCNLPCCRCFKTGNRAQRRRFSAARRPKKCEKFSVPDLHIQIVYRSKAAITNADILQFNHESTLSFCSTGRAGLSLPVITA